MSVHRQRGVALIAAVLVVALAVILVAALLDGGEAAKARTRNVLRAEQGWQLMRGLEGWAAAALKRDQEQQPGVDSRDDVWAQPLPPIELPGIRILGRLREQGGCFNLNALHVAESDNAVAIERFERLLRILNLDPAVAAQATDWIDADATPRSGGAEDLTLQQRRPPYRAANRAFAHVSELRLLPALGADDYLTLLPHVCALPASTPINLNTASDMLWMSLADDISAGAAQRMARDGRARYLSLDAVRQELERLGLPPLPLDGLGVHSDFFVLEAEIVADGVPFLYASVLQRRPDAIRVVARSRGRY